MKTKLLILSLGLFIGTNVFAESYYGDYCNFKGVISDPEITLQEQFAMLREREGFPNFQEMAKAVAALAVSPPKDLNNTNCPVYAYSRALLEYYNKNKEEIAGEKPYIAEMLNIIEKKIEEKK